MKIMRDAFDFFKIPLKILNSPMIWFAKTPPKSIIDEYYI